MKTHRLVLLCSILSSLLTPSLAKMAHNTGICFLQERENDDHEQSLLNAAYKGDLNGIKQAIQNGASIQTRSTTHNTALHYAAHLLSGNINAVEYLINKGATVDARGEDNETPLHWAVRWGETQTIRLLIERGADILAVNDDGWTPIHLAAQRGNLAILMQLLRALKAIGSNDPWKSSNTPAHIAMINGDMDALSAILRHGGLSQEQRSTLLFFAINNRMKNALLLLLRHFKVDANRRSPETQFTPLYHAATIGDDDAILALLDHRADPNAVIDGGFTALHTAAHEGYATALFLLLWRGGNSNAITHAGATVLDYATQEGHLSCVEVLLNAGAEIGVALHIAAEQGFDHILRCLLNVNPSSINELDEAGQTPLHYAARYGYESIVRILIEYGANPNILNHNFQTPAELAMEQRHAHILHSIGMDYIRHEENVNWINKNDYHDIDALIMQILDRAFPLGIATHITGC